MTRFSGPQCLIKTWASPTYPAAVAFSEVGDSVQAGLERQWQSFKNSSGSPCALGAGIKHSIQEVEPLRVQIGSGSTFSNLIQYVFKGINCTVRAGQRLCKSRCWRVCILDFTGQKQMKLKTPSQQGMQDVAVHFQPRCELQTGAQMVPAPLFFACDMRNLHVWGAPFAQVSGASDLSAV